MNKYIIRLGETELRATLQDEYIHFKINYSEKSEYTTYDTAAVYSIQGDQLYFTLKYKNGKYLEPSKKLALSNRLALFVDQLTAEDLRNIVIEGLREHISREETSQQASATRLSRLTAHRIYLEQENGALTRFEEMMNR